MVLNLKGEKVDYIISSGCGGVFNEGFGVEPLIRKLGLSKLDKQSNLVYETKTVTLNPRNGNWNGNPWHCIRPIFGKPYGINGIVNAVGLTNPGFEVWKEQFKFEIAKNPYKKWIVSLYGTQEELKMMVKSIDSWFHHFIVAISINVSCPNMTSNFSNFNEIISTCHELNKITEIPLILKLSVTQDFGGILPEVQGKIDAISINSVPWDYQFARQIVVNMFIKNLDMNKRCSHTMLPYSIPKSPLAHLGGGGVSGYAVRKYTWPMIKKLIEISDIPIIGCSVWGKNDIEKLWNMGVSAISFGAIYLLGTSLLVNHYIESYNKKKQYKEYLEEAYYK
jgi:dihydroorotate dehydrogenase